MADRTAVGDRSSSNRSNALVFLLLSQKTASAAAGERGTLPAVRSGLNGSGNLIS